jgi:hypothetical protein
MGLLDDLDLGKDQFNKDRPVELSGLDAPLPKPETSYIEDLHNPNAQLRRKTREQKLHGWEETAPPAEPVVGQETQQAYKDIKSFDSDISKLTGDITRYGDIHGSKKKALEDFHEGTLAPFWKSEFSEGFLETPDLDLNKPETVDSFISDIDSRYQQHQDRVDKGDTSWFGEDEALTRASGALRGKRKFELIRQKHARLLKDYHQSEAALERAKSRKSAMSETLMSLPENLRWAAKNWKEENPGKLLSKESVNRLLDDQKFEKPQWSSSGDLLNPGRLDPRIPLEDDGSDYMGAAIKGQKKRLEAVRRDGVSALEKDISDLEVKAGLKKHGFLYSVMGQVANRSIYISDAEKEAINVDRLQKAGITNYKGGSLEDAVNALGGEDRVIAATLIENVGNAHVAKERAKMRWIETLMTKGKEAATADLELADKNFNAAFNAAVQAGFGDEVVKRGRSDSYFGHLANSWKSGDLLEDATDFVPQLAGLADFSQTDAEKLIAIMTEMEGLETSETYEHYKLSEVDGFWDGIMHLGEHWRAIPEMVVDTLVAFTNTFATEAPRTVAPFAAGGALIGSPGGLAGAGVGGLAGTGWGLRANIGVTSFVLEYVGALLGELEKAGVDWHNPNELMAAFNNPTLMTELRTEATLKSGPVAILDMVAAGVAGKVMPIFKNPSAIKALPNGVKAFRQELRSGVHASAGRITAGAATELALQGALGGTGEALGQLLTLDPGEELDWKAIVAELGIEILGPGGVGFVHSYAKSKFGGYALEDISGATANVIGKEEVPGGFIEQVDQAGLKYERRRFHTAADYLNYVVEQTGMDLNTPTGFIVRKLVGFAQTAGKMGDLGIVVADRTPYKNKATRGAYSNGVIWLNRSALAGNPDSAPFVFLHEGGHYIQDMFFTPEQVETLYTKALPDEEARVLAWAQYKLGRSVEVLTDLSSTEQTIVNESYRSSPDAVVRAEWFTAQVAAALAIESGVVGGVTVDSAIKKAVKTMLKFVVSDETVDQFFPPQESIEQDGAVRIELLKALGFDPTTLQNNRAAFDTDIDSDAGLNQTVNPFTVNLDDMPNWPQNAKEVWARLMGYESWAKLPSKYKRTASDKGDKLKQREAAGEGDPFAEVDLSDPDTQKRIYESTDVSKKIASEEQQGGKGLEDTPVKSPEKPTPKSKVKKAVKSVKPKAQDPWLEPEPTEEAKQNVKSKVVGTSKMDSDEFVNQSERKAVKKPTAAKQKANKEQDDAEAVKNRTELREKKEKKAAAKSAPQKLQDATDRILDAQALLNQDLEAEIRDAKSRIRKRRIAHIKSLSPARIKSAKGGKSALVKAASKIYPIDLLRDIVLNDAEANSDLVALLGTSSIHEELASDASALTAQQLKQLAEQLGNVLENELEYELAKPVPEISGVLIPYGIHKIPSQELQTVEGARTPGGTATITLAENVGEVGQLVNFQEEFVQGQRSQFNINPSVYAFEITGKSSTKSTITFELKAVTESQARKSVSWLDLPASAIPSRGKPNPFHYKEPIQLLNGGRIKKQNFKDPQSEVVRQYMSVEDALKGKSKVSITGWANRKGNKEVPVRAVSRLARAKSASGTGDAGILASYTDVPTDKLDKFEITSPEARSVAGMILAAIAPTTTTSKRRVSSMQQDLKAKYDPTVAAQKAANAGNRAGRFEQTKLRTLSDDKPLSALLGLYARLKILEQGAEKPVGILGLADMMLVDIMGIESEFGFTKDQIRQEMVALTVVPNNEFMGNVDLFRAGIDIQAGESQQVAKRVDPRDDGSNATILSPTQEQRDVLDEDEAAKDAQSKGVAPSTIGTPDEGGSGESRVSSKKTRKEKAMPADLIVEDKDLAVETPKEGTWQHDFLNGVGKLKEYNWVRRLAAKLKKSGDIPKNQKVVSHPEIRELDANLSRAGEDQRHSDRLHITPRVLANMVERNGLDNLVSLPDTNKQGRVTEGGPAASALFWTGILTKIISNYGKITKGKNVPDAGITPADLQTRARALFNNYKDGKLALEDWPWKQFVADFGGPVDSSLQATAADFKAGLKDEDVQRNAQRNAARRQFIFAYFAQWARKRVAQLGGLEEKFGDKEATEGASEQVAEAPNEEGSVEEAEDLGAPSQVENLDGDVADIREDMFNGGDPIAGVIYKSLDEMTSGRTWALVSKYLDMTDAELAKDPQLRRLLKNQEVTPDQVRAMVKAALNKDQITNVTTDQQLQERLRTYIENTEKDAETKSKKGEKGRGSFGRTLGSELTLVSEMPALFSERMSAAFLSTARAGFNKIPEEWRYKIRVTMFNQHATMEDLAVKLNKDLKLKFGTDARDWFDMMGVILPTYAKVKIASRDFNSRFRQPILDMLKKHGVSETKFGRYVQALAAGTFNRHVRGLLVEARDSVNESIKSSTETIASHKKTLESEGVAEGTQKELKLAISRLEADIKKKEKDITEHYDDALYSNALGEFSPSGYSDKEAAGIVKSARNDRQLSQLLKEGEKDPSKSIMGLWAKMNATTVTHALETGQVTQEEAFKLITAKSRAGSAKELVKIVFESLELDPTDAQYAADVTIIEKTFNSKNWKDQSRIDNELELPSGYYYAPMRGFEDNAFHYEETEALGDLIKIKPEAGQSGWGARRSNEISKRALGRRKGVDKPNPATALAHAFLDHDTMVMRGAKIAPAQRMREFYEVYLEMFRNRDNLDGNIEWSENFKEIAEANGITKLFEDPSKRKVIFREFNEIFDVINESADGSMPTVEGTRLKRKTVEGRTKLVLRKGEIPLSMNDPSILLVKQKGELKYIKFKMKYSGDGSKLTGPGARIKSELGNMNFVPTNPILKFFNVPTRFLAQMYTSFNPDFILANAVRDTINALGNIREDEKKKVFKDVAALLNPANFYKVTKGIYKVERSHDEGSRSKEFAKLNRKQALDKLADNDWEGWFKFFEAHGLRTAFTSPDQITNLMEDIQKALGTTPTGIKKKIGKAKAAVLESKFVKIVEAGNAGVENTVRLVVAQRLLKSGFTVQQAVMAGRNISVDFNRKGTLSSSFGSLILFFNAGVQGNLRFIRALANRDGGAAKIAVGIMSASFLWGTLQRLLTGHDEDEDGEKEGNHYDNLGDFTKDSNIVAFVPGTEFNGRIPLPWGWNLLWMMGQKAANVAANHFGPAMGGSGVIANGASAMDNIYNTFNPVGETAMPGVFAPLYQVMQNETFYGAPITDKDRDFGTTTPASERSRKGTKDFFVDASKSINAWLGGDEISPGSLRRMFGDGEVANEMDDMLWGLSGSDLEHLFEGYTGGVGATFSRFVSGAYAGIKGNADVNLKEVPVTRRFLREGYSNYIISKRFYGLRKRTNVADEYVGNLKSGKNIEAAKEGIEANKDLLKIKPMVDAADTKRKTILRLIDKVNASKLPQSVKDQKIKEYEKQRLASWLKVLYKARKMGISV